jgi:hypothetical protein
MIWFFAGSSHGVRVNLGVFRFIIPTAPSRIKPIVDFKADHFSVFYVLNIFIVEYTIANHRNLYFDVATKLLVTIAILCVFAVALTLVTFPSSTGVIQDIFAQITPASLGNDSGNITNGTSTNNVDQLSPLIPNTTNSSSIFQLATLSSYQPITPSSYSGGFTSNDNEESSNDNEDAVEDETQDTNYSDGDKDSSDYDDGNSDDNDYDNNNGNTIIITSSGNYDHEDNDDDNSDFESDETENDGYYNDNEDTSRISIGSGGAFASASGGGSGAFASVG